MKKTRVFLIVTVLALILTAPRATTWAWTTLSGQNEDVILVTNAADAGPGTLRRALLDAQDGDTITFDPIVFSPDAPTTIYVLSLLPGINANNLTLDASNAGVTLDGSLLGGEWQAAVRMGCTGTTIRGLQITNFSGPAIDMSGEATNNVIGGDRTIGSGPFGQGNQLINNAIGVNLNSPETQHNLITGNLMGTDAVGVAQLGNERSGVWIGEGANGNTIGPDNVIAYNGQAGIFIQGIDTQHNTVTQNSIHDNAWWGINLWEGGNDATPFPGIFAYDMAAGTMTGATCPYCTVEIFSDAINEGAIFEGQVSADDRGVFTFNKGSAFAGPNLTTTATDASGNTSRFSAPLVDASWSVILQTGNSLPKTQFQAKRSNQIAGNGVGTGYAGMDWWEPDSFDHELNVITELGLKQVGLQLQENEVPENGEIDWSRDEFYIPIEFDHFVDVLVENDISTDYSLVFWDKANHPDGWQGITSRFKTEEDIQRYLDFARFFARHFKGRIQTYKLWNEPDGCGGTPEHCVEPADMINLMRRVIPVIHEEDPDAKIMIPSNVIFYDRDYLFSVLNSDVMPLVDVVHWETAPGGGGPTEGWISYYDAYPTLVEEIKETATLHGFSGEYWAGGILTWWSLGNPMPPLPYPASATRGAKNIIKGVVLHRGLGVGTYLGEPTEPAIVWPAFKNLCTAMAGLTPFDLPAVIQGGAPDLKQYGFMLPGGDYMLALWQDVEPGPDDVGMPVTVILPGLTGYWATGIDMLYGFEQQLITSDDDGNLVISNLMAKDYPILIRLAPTRYLYLPILSQN